MTLLALALSAALASTPEGSETNPLEVHLQGVVLFTPESPTQMVGARLVADQDAYVGGELRLQPNGWMAGRLGAGLDLLGGSTMDLKLGLWMGSLGHQEDRAFQSAPTLGTEVALGVRFDRLYGQHRWLVGSGPFSGLLSENETTVGFRVVDELRIYGQYTRFAPRQPCGLTALGLGAAVAF